MIWLRWTRLALRLRVEEARAAWNARGGAGRHAEVDDLLRDERPSPAVRRDPIARAYTALREDAGWSNVTETFGLSMLEQQLLALAAAVHVDHRLARVLGYLDEDSRSLPVTLDVARRVWGWAPGAAPAPSGPLVGWRIVTPVDGELAQPATPWLVDPDIAAFLCGADDWASYWPGVLRVEGDPECLHPALLDEMAAAIAPIDAAPVEVELVGRPGSGRETLLRQLATRLGREGLVIADPGLGVRALRTARLLDAVPIWRVASGAAEPTPDLRPGALAFVTREVAAATAPASGVRLSWAMPELSRAERLRLWTTAAPAAPVPPAVADWSLTPAEIGTALAAAPAGPSVAAAAIRRRLGGISNALMTPVAQSYGWADLVVAADVEEQLRTLERRVRLAGQVLDDWGFRRLTPDSRGTTALFAGPSGTGKTMAAQVLARSLELDLYRVDLAQVVNKYIGETEKRLAQVFDECERANVLVLFDEADALFGQRTRVKDAHDRFANIEIDYLLQRMESFNGVAILATNRKGDLDPAFVRRLQLIVDFLPPTPAERLRIWRLSLPAASPTGDAIAPDVDHQALADALAMTGAEIKSVALTAAFAARAADEPITTARVIAAARRELAKRGAVLRDASALATAGAGAGSNANGNGHHPIEVVR